MEKTQTTREKGNRGEDDACKYLEKQGFLIVERNYLKKWGEIDIIALKDSVLHFVEVKSSTCYRNSAGYRPEENVHALKQRRLRRTIQTYLNERKYGVDVEFRFHVITVIYDGLTGKPAITMLENIIL